MKLRSALLLILAFILMNTALAAALPLPANQAFKLNGAYIQNGDTIVTTWDVVPDYYLYKKKFQFSITNPTPITIKKIHFPNTAIYKVYPTGEKLKAFTGQFQINIKLNTKAKHSDRIKLNIEYQGCSSLGVCYPSQTKTITLSLSGLSPTEIKNAPFNFTEKNANQAPPATTTPTSEQGHIVSLLQSKHLSGIILAFFGLGLLLSLTPCVLPMIPILSGIILGQKHITHARSFGLSFIYVLAMALTYAILGVIIGLAGGQIQAALQTPWVIVLFTLIFVAMALSLFGFYELQLPEAVRHRVAVLSNHQKHGSYLGTAIMGCLSTLILSPCVTPPLAGAIVYIGDKGDALLGASALFSMGMGMGIPLLIIGATSAKLLPKAGVWMNTIKNILGAVMLAVAISMLARIIPLPISMILWGVLAIGCAIGLKAFSSTKGVYEHGKKLVGILFFIYGIILILGGSLGHIDPLKPFQFAKTSKNTSVLNFTRINSLDELNQQLQQAKAINKPVILDFYANWCVSCREMDAYTFTDPTVKSLLKPYLLLRADVTSNNANDKALEKKYNVIAPPTILFFNPDGSENKNARIVGEISAKKLIQHLKQINPNK